MPLTLTISGNQFLLGAEPFRILAGAVHYFRVPPEYWEDRLRKLKACGLNTIETYAPWNLHEPRPGTFDFSGGLNVVEFVRLAESLGLKVIIRPGPYICSEWDLGGLPAWLLKDPHMQLRCSYPPFLAAADRYLWEYLGRLAPLQASRGGPIIAVQVENEYAAYGNDEAYLRHLVETTRSIGIDALLFTSDHCYQHGLPGVLKTANFGSKAAERFADLRRFQPEGPLACMEFWAGWFDQYGKPRPTRESAELASALDEILTQGASVNFYMFHGGTNFGFLNGANCDLNGYDPRPTSYDFGALLDECGELTPKYFACREVIARHTGQVLEESFPLALKLPRTSITLTQSTSLWDNLPALGPAFESANPQAMEFLDQAYGFILYRTRLRGPFKALDLVVRDVRDRAWVFLDRKLVGILDRMTGRSNLALTLEEAGGDLEILVENMGRTNFGPEMHDRKGITHSVTLDRKYLFGWTNQPLPLNELGILSWNGGPFQPLPGPAFHAADFFVDEPRDTNLHLPGWTKGVAWINGFNLGRYWNVGPHQTLYLPGPLLRHGENELIIFELENPGQTTVELLPAPIESLSAS